MTFTVRLTMNTIKTQSSDASNSIWFKFLFAYNFKISCSCNISTLLNVLANDILPTLKLLYLHKFLRFIVYISSLFILLNS